MNRPVNDTLHHSPEWHAHRKGGIGGSEITSVLGLNPYETPHALWERKTGRRQSSPDNKFTKAGKYLEDVVARMFEDETGLEVYAPRKGVFYHHPQHDILLGSPDRFIKQKHGRDAVLEIKTTQKRGITRDTLPISWFFQVQWYMGITGAKTGYIAWLSNGIDFDHIQVEFKPDIFQDMVQQALDFWNQYVLTDTPPPPISREDIQKIIEEVRPEAIEATDEIVRLHAVMQENKSRIKELEADNDEIALSIQLAMMDREAVTWRGSTLFTWKEQSRESLDLKALQEAEPDEWARLWKRYARTKSVRVFLTK